MATHHISATDQTVHWGFFSRLLALLIEVEPGDLVTIETLPAAMVRQRAALSCSFPLDWG